MSALAMVLQADPEDDLAARQARLGELRVALERVTDLQTRVRVGTTRGLVEATRALLDELLATFAQLDGADSEPEDADSAWSDDELETWVGPRGALVSAARLSDTCFVGGFELGQARRLLESVRSDDEQLAAVEAALRKSWRAVRAVLTAAGPSPSRGPELERRERGDLELALAVRRRYASFRRALRSPADQSPEAVLTALRYAAGALAAVAASPEHAVLRVSDRTLLTKQRERLLDWSRAGKPVQGGLQLLADIFTLADLLREINRRQELRRHDQQLLRELAAAPSLDAVELLVQLERLTGLDDELDRATDAVRETGDVTRAFVRVLALIAT